jgi:tight adherence protein C
MGEAGLLIGFFAMILGLVAVVGYFLILRPSQAAAEQAAGPATLLGPAPTPDSVRGAFTDLFRTVGEAVPVSADKTGAARRLLAAAGYRSSNTVPVFYGLKCASGVLLGLLLGWLAFYSREDFSYVLLPAAAGLGLGYMLPERILRSLGRARAGRIRRALPDALDLVVLSIESGQSLDQGLLESSQELRRSCPDIAAEFGQVYLELRAGASRTDALRNLATRNNDPELKKLTKLLIQSDRFGTSLGPALRVHAKYLRVRAKQQAEEAARKISIKLLLPIFFLIFPCMLLVTAGPAILQIFTQLLPMIAGE